MSDMKARVTQISHQSSLSVFPVTKHEVQGTRPGSEGGRAETLTCELRV